MVVTDHNRSCPQNRIMCVSLASEPTVMKHVVERLWSSFLFFVLTAVLLLSGCSNKEQVQAAGGSAGRPPAPVVAAGVEQKDIPVQIRAIGKVKAYQTVQIRSQVNGQIHIATTRWVASSTGTKRSEWSLPRGTRSAICCSLICCRQSSGRWK